MRTTKRAFIRAAGAVGGTAAPLWRGEVSPQTAGRDITQKANDFLRANPQ